MMNSTCPKGWSPLSGNDWCRPGDRKSRVNSKLVDVYYSFGYKCIFARFILEVNFWRPFGSSLGDAVAK